MMLVRCYYCLSCVWWWLVGVLACSSCISIGISWVDDNCGNDCSNYFLSASVVGGADVDGVRRFGNSLRSARWSVEKIGENQALERSVLATRSCHGQAEGLWWSGMDIDDLWLIVILEEKDRVCDMFGLLLCCSLTFAGSPKLVFFTDARIEWCLKDGSDHNLQWNR